MKKFTAITVTTEIHDALAKEAGRHKRSIRAELECCWRRLEFSKRRRL